MKTSILLISFMMFTVNVIAQNPVNVSASQKVVIEKRVKDYCYYVEQLSQGNGESIAILRDDLIEQFANEAWDDIDNNGEITFDRYFKKISNNNVKIKFTEIPKRDNFLYYNGEQNENGKLIKVPFVIVPIEKIINNKLTKGYLIIRASTKLVVNFKKGLPLNRSVFSKQSKPVNIIKPVNITTHNNDFIYFEGGYIDVITDKYFKKYDTYHLRFSDEGLASYQKNGKWGFIDRNGKMIIPFIYDWVNDFSEGLALVKKNGESGFINTKGEIIIPLIYPIKFSKFSEGLAAVYKNGKWGYINKKGEVIIPFMYDHTWKFSEGLAPVTKNGKYGFIDRNGKLIIDYRYDPWYGLQTLFKDGLACVRKIIDGKDKYGYIDKNGKQVLPFIYNHAKDFKNGIAEVKLKAKIKPESYYINKRGKKLTKSNQYEYPPELIISNNKWYAKYGFINFNGLVVIPEKYDRVKPFKEGYSAVCKNKCGFIDKEGKKLISLKYQGVESFSEGLAAVQKKYKWGVINKKGKIVIPIIYDSVKEFHQGFTRIKKNGKWGVLDKKGNVIVPFEYDYISEFDEIGFARVKKNGKSGHINTKGIEYLKK